MATVKVSQLTLALLADLDDTAVLYIVDTHGASRQTTVAQLRIALGVITDINGDITVSGSGDVTATLTDRAVTFEKLQAVNTARLLGRTFSGPGSAHEVTVGTGLVLSGGVLAASSAASAAPSATLRKHRDFGGF